MVIKPTLGDLEVIVSLLRECAEHMQDQGIDQWDEHYPNADVVRNDLLNETIHAAEEDGRIVGVITLDEAQADEYKSIEWRDDSGRALVIHRLAVHPFAQGNGIAKRLLQFAETFADQNNYTSIRFDGYTMNEKAFQLYRKMNFDVRGTILFPHRTTPFYCFEKVLPGLAENRISCIPRWGIENES